MSSGGTDCDASVIQYCYSRLVTRQASRHGVWAMRKLGITVLVVARHTRLTVRSTGHLCCSGGTDPPQGGSGSPPGAIAHGHRHPMAERLRSREPSRRPGSTSYRGGAPGGGRPAGRGPRRGSPPWPGRGGRGARRGGAPGGGGGRPGRGQPRRTFSEPSCQGSSPGARSPGSQSSSAWSASSSSWGASSQAACPRRAAAAASPKTPAPPPAACSCSSRRGSSSSCSSSS